MQDNLVQTFQLDGPNLRGRIVRIGSVLHDLLHRHDYPEPVGRLTGEAAVLALLLSSMLKYDGIFTLQTQSDGPVSMLVSDITRKSIIRAMAKYKAGEIPASTEHPADLMGAGHLAFTVDQGENHERYQGIVSLTGHSLQDSVQHYFTQSEQITTGIRMVVDKVNGLWRAGAIMLQRLPEQQAVKVGEAEEDDWRRAMILMQSCRDDELLDPNLSQIDLLYRLFHEEDVRVFDPDAIEEGCRCSRERAEGIVSMMSLDERQDMTIDSKIEVKCEFCDRNYVFDVSSGD